MTNDPTKLPLPEILSEAETIARDAQSTFGHLNAAQINWKPNADAWSVGQCFDHLMTANCEYFPQIDQVIRGEKKATLWQRMPWLPGPFGKMVIGVVNPSSRRKVKNPKIFQPSSSKIDPQIISNFVAHQNEVIAKIKATTGVDLDKIIIYSPVTKVMIYSLFDAYRIIVLHERRHFQQAQRVIEAPGFPK